jgi:murein DD-endopeptidase MepM/ murein hydrolase activator NlpD
MPNKVKIDLIPNDSAPSKRVIVSNGKIVYWVFLLLLSLGSVFWLVLHPEVITRFFAEETKLLQHKQRSLKTNLKVLATEIESVQVKVSQLQRDQIRIRGFIEEDDSTMGVTQRVVAEKELSSAEILSLSDSLLKESQVIFDTIFGHPQLQAQLPLGHPMGKPLRESAKYGMRTDPFTGRKLPHFGVDFPCSKGDTIYASGGGVISSLGKDRGFGWMLVINHGRGIETTYAHLKRALISRQSKVHRGQPIALCGSSGKSTGPHLHYEMSVDDHNFDPMRVLNLYHRR